MSKLKSLDQYEKNKGIHIVLGRQPKLPEGVEPGEDLVIMGDCGLALKKRIEKAGGTCLHVPGCPPAEPVPAWVINSRGEPELESQAIDLEAVRRRQVEEDRIFKDWLKQQKRD
jgi:hypothetical protein